MKEDGEEKGFEVRQYNQPVKRYCQFMEITDSPALIQKYIECHDRVHFWKEVGEGIRAVGILEMELYIVGNKVVMIVETPLDFDWDSAMEKLSGLPRQAEWESFVAEMQGCDPQLDSAAKWHLMKRFFYLYDEKS